MGNVGLLLFWRTDDLSYTFSFLHHPYAKQSDCNQIDNTNDKKDRNMLPKDIFGLVGIHAKEHLGIGAVNAKAGVGGQESDDAANQPQGDGSGKIADFHGDVELQGGQDEGSG